MLPVETFDIPVAEVRAGYRSATYFNRAKHIAAMNPDRDAAKVVMQVFQKTNAVLCGVDEAIALLKVGAGRWRNDSAAEHLFKAYRSAKKSAQGANSDRRHMAFRLLMQLEEELDDEWINEFDELEVKHLNDGDEIEPWESVMHITGRYSSFAHLESLYLGVLARRTRVATNTARVVQAANGKPVLFFADRFDHWANQGGDGYAAHIGGADGFASDAMAAWWGDKGVGTMPHALIAINDGMVEGACDDFVAAYPDTKLIALVDFNNKCVVDAVACAMDFPALYGVRLDTSENMVDESITDNDYLMGDFKPTGVNPQLVRNVRAALDAGGDVDVKIFVSGGFNPKKIKEFEDAKVPVDSYAVGSSLLQGNVDFTADIVKPVAKMGRRFRDNPRFQ
jgi:nicotinate phosphoribosyltransferase